MAASPRQVAARFIGFAVLLGCATLAGLAAQPIIEVEDPRGKAPKRIAVDDADVKTPKRAPIDDPLGGKALIGSPPDVQLDELAQGAKEARNLELKALFAKYVVPFDRLNERTGAGNVKPIPFRRSEWGDATVIGVTPLDFLGRPREPRIVSVKDVQSVEHYEIMLQREAEGLTKGKVEGLLPAEQLTVSETLLSAALRFHDYARDRSIRRGKGWEEVRAPIHDGLRQVRLESLRNAITGGDPTRVRDVSARLMVNYPKDGEVARLVAGARVNEAERLLKVGTQVDLVAAKALIDELDQRFPGVSSDGVARIRAQLKEVAQKALVRAREKKSAGDKPGAIDELSRAVALDPNINGIRELQLELGINTKILYVGVRQYPVNMSPATARLDSEKQVVSLVFEGLLEEVPEENGSVRYRPGAALTMPTPVPGGRDFVLRAFDRDAAGRPGLDSQDIVGTLSDKLMAGRPDTWNSYPLTWLGSALPKDATAVRLTFLLGHPDPRAALTFKVLPARYLIAGGKKADDADFAERPFGTGPFRLYANPKADGNIPREMQFLTNTYYGRWKDRNGQPFIPEIRLVEVPKLDPLKAFQDDRLHLLPDVPTNEIDRYTSPANGLSTKVNVVTSSNNRRVHVLAVNLQRPYLQSKPLRKGISMAIDREDILRDVFRAGKVDFHKPMTGPYPPNSWAAPKGAVGGGPPLFNADLSLAQFKVYLADPVAKTELSLLYPEDDQRAAVACGKIKSQIEAVQRDFPGGRKVVINLEPVSMTNLLTRVQDEHRYDLAYVPFDYPDDWHPYALGAALDSQAAGRGGRNWFSFGLRESNPDAGDQQLLAELSAIRNHRDVAGEMTRRSGEVAKLFNDSLPFIPLWQLDRHMIVSKRVRVFVDDSAEPTNPRLLDQTTLFQGVARWRLE